ncbi:unnamed protein product [Durusdinium trenchii]|uniref:Uncharacterized protein n=2 Tax=Durusdinium trenchii TaxID=1381693 RepID=A0ABP0RN42_9DINO
MADQLQQAKTVVRDFVVEMRAGRRMQVLLPTGRLKSTTVSLNQELTVLRIARANQVRRLALKDIGGIFPGMELEGLRTPLDDLCATLAVRPSNEMVTFRLEHINARDTFVMCMMLFAQSQGADMGLMESPEGGEDQGEELEGEAEHAEQDCFASAAGSSKKRVSGCLRPLHKRALFGLLDRCDLALPDCGLLFANPDCEV